MLNISQVRLGALHESIYIKPQKMKYVQNGTEKTWDLLERHPSVAIVIYNVSRQVLVCVKQFRPPVYLSTIPENDRSETIDTAKYPPSLGISLEFCAGMMDKNKPPEVIAAEEVLEECGYKVEASDLERVISFQSGVGITGEKQILYYVEVTDDMKVNEGGGIDDELIDVVELNLDEARKLLEAKDIQSPSEFLFALLWFFTEKCPKK